MSKDKIKCACGSEYFRRYYPARGTWEQLVKANDNGGVTVEESFTDNLRNGREPKWMRCAECGKKIRNPDAK